MSTNQIIKICSIDKKTYKCHIKQIRDCFAYWDDYISKNGCDNESDLVQTRYTDQQCSLIYTICQNYSKHAFDISVLDDCVAIIEGCEITEYGLTRLDKLLKLVKAKNITDNMKLYVFGLKQRMDSVKRKFFYRIVQSRQLLTKSLIDEHIPDFLISEFTLNMTLAIIEHEKQEKEEFLKKFSDAQFPHSELVKKSFNGFYKWFENKKVPIRYDYIEQESTEDNT